MVNIGIQIAKEEIMARLTGTEQRARGQLVFDIFMVSKLVKSTFSEEKSSAYLFYLLVAIPLFRLVFFFQLFIIFLGLFVFKERFSHIHISKLSAKAALSISLISL